MHGRLSKSSSELLEIFSYHHAFQMKIVNLLDRIHNSTYTQKVFNQVIQIVLPQNDSKSRHLERYVMPAFG